MSHPLVEYTNLLKKHRTPDCQEAQDFVAQYIDDPVTTKRLNTLSTLWRVFKLPPRY